MAVHLQREIEKLKKQIILYGGMVEKNVENAIRSIQEKDAELARQVLEADTLADQWEVDVEEECLKILALHQPVAVDLRFIVAVLKINNDLERIGDLAVNIAERAAARLTPDPARSAGRLRPPVRAGCRKCCAKSLDALVNLDAPLAHQVRSSDDEIDEMVHAQFIAA